MHTKISAIILHKGFLQILDNPISILFMLMTTAKIGVQITKIYFKCSLQFYYLKVQKSYMT